MSVLFVFFNWRVHLTSADGSFIGLQNGSFAVGQGKARQDAIAYTREPARLDLGNSVFFFVYMNW